MVAGPIIQSLWWVGRFVSRAILWVRSRVGVRVEVSRRLSHTMNSEERTGRREGQCTIFHPVRIVACLCVLSVQ